MNANDDEVYVGECFGCKQQRDIVATMTITARWKEEVLGTKDVDLCDTCATKAVNDAAPLADSITIDGVNAKDLLDASRVREL